MSEDTSFLLARREREREEARKRIRCMYRRKSNGWKHTVLSAEEKEAARVLTRSARTFIRQRRETAQKYAEKIAGAARCIARALRLFLLRRQAERRFAHLRRIKAERERQKIAACILTQNSKRFLARLYSKKQRQAFINAAFKISKAWRLYLLRRSGLKFYHSLKLFVGLVQKHIKERRRVHQTRCQAATCISTRIRGLLEIHNHKVRIETERAKIQHQRENVAAQCLVRMARSWFTRRKIAKLIRRRLAEKKQCLLISAYLATCYFHIVSNTFTQTKIKTKAALCIVHFIRIALIKIRRYRRERRRLLLYLALTLQRLWRGRLGRARFRRFRNESYKCRRCGGMEFGGFYCKRCGFCRYEQTKQLPSAYGSPYLTKFKPGLVKRIRAVVKHQKQRPKKNPLPIHQEHNKKTRGESSIRDHPLDPQTDANLSRETERLLAFSKSLIRRPT